MRLLGCFSDAKGQRTQLSMVRFDPISNSFEMSCMSSENDWLKKKQSKTNGPINAHLTIAQVMPKYNHKNEKQEALSKYLQ